MAHKLEPEKSDKPLKEKYASLVIELDKEQYGFILFMSGGSSPEEYVVELIQDQVQELNAEVGEFFGKRSDS